MTRKRKNDIDTGAVHRYSDALHEDTLNDDWDSAFVEDFEKRYGHVEYGGKRWKRKPMEHRTNYTGTNLNMEHTQAADLEQHECSAEYPSELVEYMKHVASTIRDNPSGSDDLRKKCLEECRGSEIAICMYDLPCRLVEEIFNGCRETARHWMLEIMHSKKKMQLQILCMPWACHTLETLLSSLSNTLDAEIVEHWVDLITENWLQLVADKNASYFIRTLTYHLVGVTRKNPREKETKEIEWPKKLQKKMKADSVAKEFLERIANVALDYVSMKDGLEDESVSLVVQDVVECCSIARSGRIRGFAEASCNDDPSTVREQWKGKQASRLWQIIVQKVDEDMRQHLYHSVLEGKLLDLALNRFANFPVQNYIAAAKSDELIMDIFEELMKHFEDICANGKWGVCIALIRIARNENEVIIIKKLKNYFNCDSKSAKSAFVPNIFTLDGETYAQSNDAGTFDVTKGKLHGSLILQELLNFEHIKTVIFSLKSLRDATIVQLAQDKKGSFILQALFRSSTIPAAEKEQIAKPLKHRWREVINGDVSSHVFDAMWENGIYTIKEKEVLMDALSKTAVEGRSKIMRLMCAKLNLQGFREQRKKWLKDAAGAKSRN